MAILRISYTVYRSERDTQAGDDAATVLGAMERMYAQAASLFDGVGFTAPAILDEAQIKTILAGDAMTPEWHAIRRATLRIGLPHPQFLNERQFIDLPPVEMIGSPIVLDPRAEPLPFYYCRYPALVPITTVRNGRMTSVPTAVTGRKLRCYNWTKDEYLAPDRGNLKYFFGNMAWHPDTRAFDDVLLKEQQEFSCARIVNVPDASASAPAALVINRSRTTVDPELFAEQAHLYPIAEIALGVLNAFAASQSIRIHSMDVHKIPVKSYDRTT